MVHILSRSVTLLIFCSLSLAAKADVLFEGYSKVTSGGVHIGYVVSRYEFDAKKKQFLGTYMVKTGALGSDVTESVKSVADQDLNPISYEYTSLVGKKTKTIDAKFAKGKMTATVTEGGTPKKMITDIPKGTLLSNFLVYLILKSKNGLQPGQLPFTYKAIAEEDGLLEDGVAKIEKEEKFHGFRAFKISNKFKDVTFTSYVSERGEVLATTSPANGIGTELMEKPNDAVGKFGLSTSILKHLFGEVPLGTNNLLSKAAKEEALGEPKKPGKKEGIPGGQGVQIKTGTPAAPEEVTK